jgi:hypothetical protein
MNITAFHLGIKNLSKGVKDYSEDQLLCHIASTYGRLYAFYQFVLTMQKTVNHQELSWCIQDLLYWITCLSVKQGVELKLDFPRNSLNLAPATRRQLDEGIIKFIINGQNEFLYGVINKQNKLSEYQNVLLKLQLLSSYTGNGHLEMMMQKKYIDLIKEANSLINLNNQ